MWVWLPYGGGQEWVCLYVGTVWKYGSGGVNVKTCLVVISQNDVVKIHSIGKVYLFWTWMIKQSIYSNTMRKNGFPVPVHVLLSISVWIWPCRVFLSILVLFCIQHLVWLPRLPPHRCISLNWCYWTHQHWFTASPFDKHKAKIGKMHSLGFIP